MQEPAIFEQEEFIRKWRTRGVNAVTFYVLSEHDRKTGDIIRKKNFRNDNVRYPCASPWVQTVIMPDGAVGLCCKTMTDLGWKITSMGNINEKSLDEIWNGYLYRKVRRELLENKFTEFSTCKNCLIWSASTYETEYHRDYIKTYNESMETLTFT